MPPSFSDPEGVAEHSTDAAAAAAAEGATVQAGLEAAASAAAVEEGEGSQGLVGELPEDVYESADEGDEDEAGAQRTHHHPHGHDDHEAQGGEGGSGQDEQPSRQPTTVLGEEDDVAIVPEPEAAMSQEPEQGSLDDPGAEQQRRQLLDRAEALKQEGNTLYAADDCDGAIDKYMQAIDVSPPGATQRAVYYANIAACHLRYCYCCCQCNALQGCTGPFFFFVVDQAV